MKVCGLEFSERTGQAERRGRCDLRCGCLTKLSDGLLTSVNNNPRRRVQQPRAAETALIRYILHSVVGSSKMPGNNSTIDSFFPRLPKSAARRQLLKDDIEEAPNAWNSENSGTYHPVKIGSIHPGPCRITFTGRVGNYQAVEKNSRLATAAKVLLRMALMDGTGIVDVPPPLHLSTAGIDGDVQVKFWLTRPLAVTRRVKLGAIATVHATFVAPLSPAEREKSSAVCMITISDTDPAANVEFLKDSDENWADFRIPVGLSGGAIPGLVPLKVFVEDGSDFPGARLLVCVKWVCWISH